jgi:serine/threonine-protein kinase
MAQSPSGASGPATTSRWIWPFELLEKIGEGGMGVVYRARYVGNNRIVAVKLLPQDLSADPVVAARFDRELEILKQLRHPNIVHCFGGVCESRQRFYAMELVEGGTLSDLLREKQRFSWDYVVEYGLQMCDALHYAHERGIVHRDVKPANFLLGKAHQLKLSDFGLATMASATKITRAGKTAGTFLYMAPEQIRGQPPVSAQTDLYALGCVFFELLTGRPPFQGESPAVILRKHLKDTPPRVASLVLDCPAALDELIADLLQKNPVDRPESAAAVATRLRSILRPSIAHVDPLAQTPAHPVPAVAGTVSESEFEAEVPARPIRSVLPWLVAVVICACLAASGWWRAAQLSQEVAQLERAWVETAANGPLPVRVAALQKLAQLDSLGTDSAAAVCALLDDPDPAIRLAVLRFLQRRPQHGEGKVALLTRIQQRDANDEVRSAAAAAVIAIRDNPDSATAASRWWAAAGCCLLTAGAIGWWWLRQHRQGLTLDRIFSAR